jgi:hypothetical protein
MSILVLLFRGFTCLSYTFQEVTPFSVFFPLQSSVFIYGFDEGCGIQPILLQCLSQILYAQPANPSACQVMDRTLRQSIYWLPLNHALLVTQMAQRWQHNMAHNSPVTISVLYQMASLCLQNLKILEMEDNEK